MTRTPWFLGIDLGTGSCKCLAVDEDGRELGIGAQEYPGAEARGRWQEQDPQGLFDAAAGAVRRAVAPAGLDPGACAGLSVGGALHSLLALDGRDNPLTGVITWADGRAVDQARAVAGTPLAGSLYRRTGCPAHGMYPLYKVIWLRENRPEIFAAAARYVSAKEYLVFRLSGTRQVDYAIAAGSGFLDTHTLDWCDAALDLAGVRRAQLSRPTEPAARLGPLLPEAAAAMGLAAGTPVYMGASDAVNSSIGAGAVEETQATLMIGTSGALRVVSPRPVLDPQGRSWCYAIDRAHWLVGGAINNGGVALSWLRDCLNRALGGAAAAPLGFDDVLGLASGAPAGAGGLICLPFFAGERSPNWNLNARAVFFGMALTHEARHLARALVEGIAFRFRNLLEVLNEIGLDVRGIAASGGFTRSALWMQIMADALRRELAVPLQGEGSALAAAFWPYLGSGGAAELGAIRNWVRFEKTLGPVAAHCEVYDRIYPVYLRLYRALTGAFDEIARLQLTLPP
jgi:gluconokinase